MVRLTEREYRSFLQDREQLALVIKQLAVANESIARLSEHVGLLATQVAAGNERITELTAIAQRKARKQSSKKPPKTPLAPAHLDEDTRKAYENRPRPPKREKRKKKPKSKSKPTGRKPVPEHLEAEEHTVFPDTSECVCKTADFEVVDEVVEVKLHIVREHQRRRVVTRKTCRCKTCGERRTARSLPSPFARSKATCEWLAWMVHQKFGMLVPLDRIRRDLESRGVKLAMSYFVSQIERVADLLAPIDGEHWKQLLGGEWMAMDATGLKVMVPELAGTHQGYLEVFQNGETVVFQYEPHKGMEPLVAKLVPFKGILVADAEHRHNGVFEDGSVREGGCNAHPRRKLRDCEISHPTLAKEGGQFLGAMFDLEAEAKRNRVEGPELLAWRQDRIRPLYDEFGEWMSSVEPTLTPDDALAKVIRYFRNHWDALRLFLDHPEIPMDNSGSERLYQNVAKLRLNSLFAGSTEGAHRMAVLLGIEATCRAVGVHGEEYMAWALTRLGTHRDVYNMKAAELTPAAYSRWKKSHD